MNRDVGDLFRLERRRSSAEKNEKLRFSGRGAQMFQAIPFKAGGFIGFDEFGELVCKDDFDSLSIQAHLFRWEITPEGHFLENLSVLQGVSSALVIFLLDDFDLASGQPTQ